MLNVHPSMLPRWRGAAPIERAIMAGDTGTGVSIMQVTAGLDSGPVCAQRSERIQPEDTYGTLAPRLAELGGALLVWTLAEPRECIEQDESLATYAEKIRPEDRRLDPARPAAELERVVRALEPAHRRVGRAQGRNERGSRGGPGAALRHRAAGRAPDRRTRRTGPCRAPRARSSCSSVKPPGRREMSGEDWLRGLRR